MYSGMRPPQPGEVAEQSTVHLEVLWVQEEVQRPGNGVIQNERCSE